MRSRAQVRVDRLGFYVYNGVQVAVLVRTWGKLPLWELAALVLAGYVLADLFTGLLHWFFDTWGSPETPVLGQVIAPFRQHHQTPLDIVRHDFLDSDFAFLQKPFTASSLAQKVRDVLDQPAQRA